MEFKDYYAVLGVDRQATQDDIKKGFRKLARKYHPDVSKEADAEKRMAEVNEAYAVLSDPEKRAAYDSVGQGRRAGESFTPPPNWDAGFEFSSHGFTGAEEGDFSNFFSELFGRRGFGGGGRRGRAGGAQMRGEDHHAAIELDLMDAYAGAQRQIQLKAPRLDAQGRLVNALRTLDVRIPKGVKEGQMIRLAGQGSPGHNGAPAGDLFLEVRFRPNPRFKVNGRDLIAELPIAPWEAALGAVVPVSLPDGSSMKVRIPAGAQSGRQLTVRGKGLPGTQPGDLDLTLRVVLPSADDPKAKAIYEQMAKELDFDARRAAAQGD